jgi:hypothetical protein
VQERDSEWRLLRQQEAAEEREVEEEGRKAKQLKWSAFKQT